MPVGHYFIQGAIFALLFRFAIGQLLSSRDRLRRNEEMADAFRRLDADLESRWRVWDLRCEAGQPDPVGQAALLEETVDVLARAESLFDMLRSRRHLGATAQQSIDEWLAEGRALAEAIRSGRAPDAPRVPASQERSVARSASRIDALIRSGLRELVWSIRPPKD